MVVVIAVLIVVVRRVQVAVEMVVLVHVNPLVQADVHPVAQALARVAVVLIAQELVLEQLRDNVLSVLNNVCNIVDMVAKTLALVIVIRHVIGLAVDYVKPHVKLWGKDQILVSRAMVHVIQFVVLLVRVTALDHVVIHAKEQLVNN